MFVCPECGQRYERAGYCLAEGRPLVATDDPLLGTMVGRYRLARLIGEGGMGTVYLGIQPEIGSRVAIKVLSEQCVQKPDLVERFFAEAKAVNLIRHESIVNIVDMATLDDGRPYIVMEYVEGRTLGALVEHGTAPLGGIVQVFGEVLSALAAAHAIGIVHRDLKPDNILVTAEGHAKVLDFGVAKLAPGLAHLSPRTRTGALLGTPTYMAPEQIDPRATPGGGAIDPRTDVYAAGVVLYQAVTGRVPFAAETLFELMRQHLEHAPVPPSQLRRELPASIERVILTALEKDPARRFPSARELGAALAEAATELPAGEWRALSRGAPIPGAHSVNRVRASQASGARATAAAHEPTAPPPPPRRDRRLAIAIGGIVVVAGVVAVGVVAGGGSEPGDARTAGADDLEPIILGGGSAADHGVHTGSNVHHGPGVIIGGSRTKVSSVPADYDPKRFDVLGYLPRAQVLARAVQPDAVLTDLHFYGTVSGDGLADLTAPAAASSFFQFRSPARSAAAGSGVDVPCYVMIVPTPAEVNVLARVDDECDAPIATPRCTIPQVWAKAQRKGARLAAATVTFAHQRWELEAGATSVSLPDCK